MIATSESRESLVTACVQRDRAEECFRDALREARKGVKPAPGGVRKWIFHQCAHGAYIPQRAIFEFIDKLASNPNATEENVLKIGQCFVDYTHQVFAVRDAKRVEPSIRETLQLSVGANADEMKADAALINEPDSISAIEAAISTTENDLKVDEKKLTLFRAARARIRFGRGRSQ